MSIENTFHQDVINFKNYLIQNGLKGIVLDIDETLSLTAEHWFYTLNEMFPNPENLTPKKLAEKYHVPNNYPHWKSNENVMEWIRNARLDHDAHFNALPIEESKKALKDLMTKVPIIGYISARFIDLKPTTKKWLHKHNFPELPILHKDNDSDIVGGNLWKSKVLNYLYPYVEAIVDDNPTLIDFLDELNYEGTVYLYKQKPKKNYNIQVICCSSWEEISEKLLNKYS